MLIANTDISPLDHNTLYQHTKTVHQQQEKVRERGREHEEKMECLALGWLLRDGHFLHLDAFGAHLWQQQSKT